MRALIRQVAIVCGVLAAVALVVRVDRPQLALGVVGGGVLVVLAIWAIAGTVEQVLGGEKRPETRGISARWLLVKFFTRHAILAFAAYGMMLRLHLDPIGMLIGVSSVVVAAAMTTRRR